MRVLMFIGLKASEIAAIVFVPHYIGRAICTIDCMNKLFRDPTDGDVAPYWIVGVLCILLVAVGAALATSLCMLNIALMDKMDEWA